MGCVSSKILTKSGSFQESVSQSFQRNNNVIEEIILSSSRSNNGDQFLALIRTSSSSVRNKAQKAEQSAAVAEQPANKIETINVSELLAGLEEEEENCAAEQEKNEQQGDRKEGDRSRASDGDAAGRARSFRTVEEFDALVTQSKSSEPATAPANDEQEEDPGTAAASTSSGHGATGKVEESSSPGEKGEAAGQAENAGAKKRARARQLGELKVPTTFDFSKSGSLRDWLLRGGQIFSPGSYVTPKFGTAPAAPPPPEDRGGEKQQHAVFDPELVAQFERAMEQLSDDEERVLTEILEALELETGEKDGAAPAALGRVNNQPDDAEMTVSFAGFTVGAVCL